MTCERELLLKTRSLCDRVHAGRLTLDQFHEQRSTANLSHVFLETVWADLEEAVIHTPFHWGLGGSGVNWAAWSKSDFYWRVALGRALLEAVIESRATPEQAFSLYQRLSEDGSMRVAEIPWTISATLIDQGNG